MYTNKKKHQKCSTSTHKELLTSEYGSPLLIVN